MTRIENVLASPELTNNELGSYYELNRFLFDVNPHIGFGITGMVTLVVQPEIQFFWQKIE